MQVILNKINRSSMRGVDYAEWLVYNTHREYIGCIRKRRYRHTACDTGQVDKGYLYVLSIASLDQKRANPGGGRKRFYSFDDVITHLSYIKDKVALSIEKDGKEIMLDRAIIKEDDYDRSVIIK